MALTIGIVGLPNAGKSTLFNALTKNDVLAANYPFATIEPNVGVVGVPDDRLPKLAEIYGSQKLLPATVEFVDIAGIVRGASQGEGLGNKFLSHIREAAAICQVTRVFRDEDVTHVDGKVDPGSDISTIQTELILADLETVEKAITRLEKESRKDKDLVPVLAAAQEAKQALEAGTPVIATSIDRTLIRELSLLTAKPYIYVFNCDTDELADEELKDKMRALVAPAEAIFLDAKLESELVELDDDEARELLTEVGITEPGLDVLARVGFDTLGLQTYLTAGPKEVRAWEIKKGATAPEAAGVIHTDFQKGFIKAEIISYDDLISIGTVLKAREAGQGPDGGQGLRHAGRRRGGVPLQRLDPRARSERSRDEHVGRLRPCGRRHGTSLRSKANQSRPMKRLATLPLQTRVPPVGFEPSGMASTDLRVDGNSPRAAAAVVGSAGYIGGRTSRRSSTTVVVRVRCWLTISEMTMANAPATSRIQPRVPVSTAVVSKLTTSRTRTSPTTMRTIPRPMAMAGHSF